MIPNLNVPLTVDRGSEMTSEKKQSGNGGRCISSNLSRLIHQIRLGRNLTRIELSEHLDITLNHLYLIETGYRFPSIRLVLKIAETFNLNPFWMKRLWLRDHLNIVEERMNHKLGLN